MMKNRILEYLRDKQKAIIEQRNQEANSYMSNEKQTHANKWSSFSHTVQLLGSIIKTIEDEL